MKSTAVMQNRVNEMRTIRRAALELDTGHCNRCRPRDRSNSHVKRAGRRGSQQTGVQRGEAHVGGVGRERIVCGASEDASDDDGGIVVAVCNGENAKSEGLERE